MSEQTQWGNFPANSVACKFCDAWNVKESDGYHYAFRWLKNRKTGKFSLGYRRRDGVVVKHNCRSN